MRTSGNGGFTLIELILVTVILGILASMVAMNFSSVLPGAQVRAAKGDIATISTALDVFALNHNANYPKTLPEVNTPTETLLKKPVPPFDPWGNPYNYKPPTNAMLADYEVFSSGPDGVPNTADDITRISNHDAV